MRALVYHGNNDIRYDSNFPNPEIKYPTQVKLKIDYCGICGSDLHELLDGPIFFQEANPISGKGFKQCMGHEMCGEIVEIGPKVTGFKIGDKVVVDACGTCNNKSNLGSKDLDLCEACEIGKYNCCEKLGFIGLGFDNGGFADEVVLDFNHLIKYNPDILPVEIAAVTEPLAVAWHAVSQSGIQHNHSALILGAGPIGLSTIFALKGNKIQNIVISEPSKARRELAQSFGIKTFDPSKYSNEPESLAALKSLSHDGKGFHRTYDCSGIPVTFNASIKLLRTGGIATNIAIWGHKPIDFYPMNLTLHETFLTGSMCYTKKDFQAVIRAYEDGLIDPQEVKNLVTAVIPIKDCAEKGFKELINNNAKHIKILVTPHLD